MLRLALLAVLLEGCVSPCSAVCARMARFAEEECGAVVPDAQVNACLVRMADAPPEDQRACAQNGTRRDIEAELSCNDVADYFEVADTGS